MKTIGLNISAASDLMEANSLDALISSSPENVFYTSGLPTRQAEYNPILFTLGNQYPFFVATFADKKQSVVAWKGFDFKLSWVEDSHGILSRQEAVKELATSLKENLGTKQARVAVESNAPLYLADSLRSAGLTIVPIADQLFSQLRSIKTEEEISRIRRASIAAEHAISTVLDSISPGVSEIELTRVAKIATVEKGAMGWDHITLSVGASDPEYPGIGVTMREGDIARIDIGAIYSGYTSDISRNASLGSPSHDVKKIYEAILEAQDELIDRIQPQHTKAYEVYEIAKNSLAKHSYQVRAHYVGHGIGIQTEEDPLLKPGYETVLRKGMTINIEIWVDHKPSRSLGIEDMFVVGQEKIERLSTLERKLFVV